VGFKVQTPLTPLIIRDITYRAHILFCFSHWLVITEDGHMVTGRQQPRLVLVSLNCEGGQLCLNAPQMEELRVPLHQPSNAVVDCRYMVVLQTVTHPTSPTLKGIVHFEINF